MKNNLLFKGFLTISLLGISVNVNAETLSEKNAEDILLIKKAVVKLIKEKDIIRKNIIYNRKYQEELDKKIVTLEKEIAKSSNYKVKGNIKKKEIITKVENQKQTKKRTRTNNILKNKEIENKKKQTKQKNENIAKSYKTLVLKVIYEKPNFGSKKIGKLQPNEIFKTKNSLSKKGWIKINDNGWIHFNKLVKKEK